MGQSEVQNYLKSEEGDREPRLMRYAGEYKFAGGSVDAGETLEQAARRELEEEFGCRVPPEARLRVFDVKQTRPVQSTSFIMNSFLCLESENPWLAALDAPALNRGLAARRAAFHAISAAGGS